MDLLKAIGWLGAFGLAICGLPQAIAAVRTKDSSGITWWMLILWWFGELLTMIYVWAKYSLTAYSMPLILNYVLNIVIVAVIAYYKFYPGGRHPRWWRNKRLKAAIRKQIRKESRLEAMLILLSAGEEAQVEFLKYHDKDQGNICCMVLDKWKDDLIKRGLMKNDGDFGGFYEFKV